MTREVQNDQSDLSVCSTICTTKLFFSAVAVGDEPGLGAVVELDDPGVSPPMDAIAFRKSRSRFPGTSARMLTRPASGTPFVADPPNRETVATTLSATTSSFPLSAGIVISVTPKAFGAGVSVAARSI